MTTNTKMGLIAVATVSSLAVAVVLAILLLGRSPSTSPILPSTSAPYVEDSNGTILDGPKFYTQMRGQNKDKIRAALGEPASVEYPRLAQKSKRYEVWTYNRYVSNGSQVLRKFEVEFDNGIFMQLTMLHD